jgi:hypothetical protein
MQYFSRITWAAIQASQVDFPDNIRLGYRTGSGEWNDSPAVLQVYKQRLTVKDKPVRKAFGLHHRGRFRHKIHLSYFLSVAGVLC